MRRYKRCISVRSEVTGQSNKINVVHKIDMYVKGGGLGVCCSMACLAQHE